jgi:hypothetical protein
MDRFGGGPKAQLEYTIRLCGVRTVSAENASKRLGALSRIYFVGAPYRVEEYIISTACSPLTFTSVDIPRARRAAREIAEGAGLQSIRE